MCFDDFSDFNDAFDGDDLQNFSDREAWEDSQADMMDYDIDEDDFDDDPHMEDDPGEPYYNKTPLGHEYEGE